jgi:hypothetical protein
MLKAIKGRYQAAFSIRALPNCGTFNLARIAGGCPNFLIPPPRRALDIVKQLRSLGEIAKKAGQALHFLFR